ncbi:MAG: DMT family transporter [Clostridiales Family XIII bacterium]|jgi:drug/metabolite transporter (DMT)-like permease|nr:DMT family transporter [Clostridiales Family XIII bacterium]
MSNRSKSILLLFAAGVLWSLGGVLVKTADANPFAISSIRGGVAAIVFFIALKGKPKITFAWPQMVGAIGYACTLTCFVISNKLTSAANAILLQYTSTVWIAVLSYFILKERLHRFDYASILGVMIGMWLIVKDQLDGRSAIGNIIALIGGFAFAFVPVMVRKQKDGSPYETIFLGNVLTFLIGLPFLFIAPPPLTIVPQVVFLGVFQIGIAYLLYVPASRHAKALDLSIIPSIEVVLNPLLVFFVTKEIPGFSTFIGGGVLMGVIILRSILLVRASPDKNTNMQA